MKRNILLLLLACVAMFAQARNTIHWITFVDTTDPNVGQIDVNTEKLLYSKWIQVINSALAEKGYKADIHRYNGSQTSPENCKSIVTSLSADKDDIIVFYYVGHGARAMQDKSRYPQMLLAQTYENKCVPLEWVHRELKKKGARLTITFGMCCNSYAEVLSAKDNIAFFANKGVAYVNTDDKTNIQKLFLNNTGDIIMSSSQAGQSSWGKYIEGIGDTDYFSYNLMRVFNNYVSKSYVPDWESILTDVQTLVNNQTLADSRRSNVEQQTPIFDINVSQVTEPEPTVSDKDIDEAKKDVANSVPDSDDFNQQLTAAFDLIINPGIPRTKRRELGYTLRQYFASDAVIRVYAQDFDLVIDKDDLDGFFSRITFSEKLLKVLAVKCSFNSGGKIKDLYIREYYKR
ncbi:MAG: caspase family protein [Bacteroidaceae bacterium]|nr:caspase family protein [Bacteroidaceae bacterium]